MGNTPRENLLIAKIKNARQKHLPYNEITIRRLATAATLMLAWLLIWALVLKCGSEIMLIRNYTNLKHMTVTERIMWDLIPFNYRPVEGKLANLLIDTLLNCFVFAPLSVALCYVFKKQNPLRNIAFCLGLCLAIEIMQLLTRFGNLATEDFITNVTGCIIGFGIYNLLFKRLSVKQNVRFLAVANGVLAGAVIFSLVTTVIASDVIFEIVSGTL